MHNENYRVYSKHLLPNWSFLQLILFLSEQTQFDMLNSYLRVVNLKNFCLAINVKILWLQKIYYMYYQIVSEIV